MANNIVHFEFAVKDINEGTEFYSKLFDWSIDKMPGAEYSLVNTGSGDTGGGIYTAPKGTKPFITVYVQVDDIDAKLSEAEALGASIISQKTKISDDHGYFGMFRDP